ncbi:MAG: AmmeMemoRadiSam system protein A [Candidatus Buchananbacteria bacterium]|nr:AmmeMemoRadiSam system protein A [Candidatus Buchananbacteria bacterium]
MDNGYYTSGEKEFLLKIAIKSLEKFLLSGEKFEPQTINKKLWEKRGVFVTLYLDHKLRGCMGTVEPVESLILSVRNNALLAALDPRFKPLKMDELKSIIIEISILSEPQKTDLNGINYGDGVLIKRGQNFATYLPSVWKQLNDKDKFLASLCEKAGLGIDAYHDPETDFFVYSAISFK